MQTALSALAGPMTIWRLIMPEPEQSSADRIINKFARFGHILMWTVVGGGILVVLVAAYRICAGN